MPSFHSLFRLSVFAALLLFAVWGGTQRVDGQDNDAVNYLIVTNWNDNSVYRYEATTGLFVDKIESNHENGLVQPWACIFSPYDGSLLVSAGHFIPGRFIGALRFDGETLEFIDEFTPQMTEPHAITFGPDGNLYIGQRRTADQGAISRFDGLTGKFIDDFVPLASGGLVHPTAHVFGPSGKGNKQLDLYVSDGPSGNILRYDGTTGEFLGEFVTSGSGGLEFPVGLTFGPDGDLYVADDGYTNPAVLRFEGPAKKSPGAFVERFVTPGSGGLLEPFGLLFGPDANGDGAQDLYVNSQHINPNSYRAEIGSSSVKLYDGVTGDYIRDFVPLGGDGELSGPALMTFTLTDPVTLKYLGN